MCATSINNKGCQHLILGGGGGGLWILSARDNIFHVTFLQQRLRINDFFMYDVQL